MKKKCAYCGNEFETTSARQIYCSDTHRVYGNRKKKEKDTDFEAYCKEVNKLPDEVLAWVKANYVPNRETFVRKPKPMTEADILPSKKEAAPVSSFLQKRREGKLGRT